MRTQPYRWVRTWSLIHNIAKDGPPPQVGEIVQVGKADGSTDFLEIDGVLLFTSKKGEACARMFTKVEDNV